MIDRIKQYFKNRKASCKFPYGHDMKWQGRKEHFKNTNQYINGSNIVKKCTYDEAICSRCGEVEWYNHSL